MLEIRTPGSRPRNLLRASAQKLERRMGALIPRSRLTPTATNLTSAPFVLGFLGGAQRLSHLDEVRQSSGGHLFHDVATMNFDRYYAQLQLTRNLLVHFAGCHQRYDLLFARRERRIAAMNRSDP